MCMFHLITNNDCYNLGCPFRSNHTSSLYYCECSLCPRRTAFDSKLTYSTNTSEVKKKNDQS